MRVGSESITLRPMRTHPLESYLAREGETQVEFAARLGVSKQQVNNVLRGRAWFGRAVANRVVEITGGAVSLEKLMTWGPKD